MLLKLAKIILTASTIAALPLLPGIVCAQTTVSPAPQETIGPEISDPLLLGRAQNLARQAAIKANGGLSKYRPAPAAFGPAIQSPHVVNSDGSITFTIRGGAIGYKVPTQETVVTVAPNNSVLVRYNGPIRTGRIGEPTLPAAASTGIGGDTFLIRAQNLARQAAIEANKGLDNYRPEPSMFSRAENAPYVKNADGSVTFTFTGSPPNSSTPAIKSVVTVTQNDIVTVDYNGPIR